MDSGFAAEPVIGPAEGRTRWRRPRMTVVNEYSIALRKDVKMSLKIRRARAGTKKRPMYHIVVADSRSPRDGRFIERLGYFNPLLPKENADRLKFDIEKAKGWLAKGAAPSD